MRTLYLECNMGASGDMLFGALLELHPDPAGFIDRMNRLGIPGVTISYDPKAVSCGITGTHVTVLVNGVDEEDFHHEHEHSHEHHHEHDHEHHEHEHPHDHPHSHTALSDLRPIVAALPISSSVKLEILSVYREIAEAEGKVHGSTPELVHFHEVGAMDALADITGVCLLLDELDADRICCSTVHTGFGQVRCAHGILPVPAPATAQLLRGIPCTTGPWEGELCTPTGAALLRHFVDSFDGMPEGLMTERIGLGLGTRQFPAANLLRAWIGEVREKKPAAPAENSVPTEEIWELKCNLDDCTGEEIACACELLLTEGALDVFTQPIMMKKGRPAVLMTVLCRPADEEKLTRLLLLHTTTLGVRRTLCKRTSLARREITVPTEYGPIRLKYSEGEGVSRGKAEYDDVAAAAKKYGVPFSTVKKAAERSEK